MRFIVMVKATPASEAGALPARDAGQNGRFQRATGQSRRPARADGLHPTSKGARISFAGSKPTVTDGPFTEQRN